MEYCENPPALSHYYLLTYTLTLSQLLLLSPTHTHTHTLSLSLSLSLSLHTHTHTHINFLSHSHPNTHTHTCRIIEVFAVLSGVLVVGSWAFGLVMVNGSWDPAEWLFLGFCCALVLSSNPLAFFIILVWFLLVN